jgi:hypothetical protein
VSVGLLIVGGLVVLFASVLGGATGSGFALVCAPVLLVAAYLMFRPSAAPVTDPRSTAAAAVGDRRGSEPMRRHMVDGPPEGSCPERHGNSLCTRRQW